MPIFAQSEIRAKLRCAKMNLREFADARIALNSKLLKKLKDVSAVELRFRNKIIIRSKTFFS